MCSLLLSAAQGIETLEAEIVLLREKNRRLGEGRPSGNIKTLVFGDITGSKKKYASIFLRAHLVYSCVNRRAPEKAPVVKMTAAADGAVYRFSGVFRSHRVANTVSSGIYSCFSY